MSIGQLQVPGWLQQRALTRPESPFSGFVSGYAQGHKMKMDNEANARAQSQMETVQKAAALKYQMDSLGLRAAQSEFDNANADMVELDRLRELGAQDPTKKSALLDSFSPKSEAGLKIYKALVDRDNLEIGQRTARDMHRRLQMDFSDLQKNADDSDTPEESAVVDVSRIQSLLTESGGVWTPEAAGELSQARARLSARKIKMAEKKAEEVGIKEVDIGGKKIAIFQVPGSKAFQLRDLSEISPTDRIQIQEALRTIRDAQSDLRDPIKAIGKPAAERAIRDAKAILQRFGIGEDQAAAPPPKPGVSSPPSSITEPPSSLRAPIFEHEGYKFQKQ